MKTKHLRLTVVTTYMAMALVVAVAIFLPWILKLNSIIRVLLPVEQNAILAGFYCCAPVLLLTLWKVRQLLKNIQLELVFTEENIKLLAAMNRPLSSRPVK